MPEREIKKGLLRALPGSARSSFKKGRPVTRRPSALRALQLWIDGQKWLPITQLVCDCPKKKHDQYCDEAIRQSVIGLKQLLRQLGIELPKRQQYGRNKNSRFIYPYITRLHLIHMYVYQSIYYHLSSRLISI